MQRFTRNLVCITLFASLAQIASARILAGSPPDVIARHVDKLLQHELNVQPPTSVCDDSTFLRRAFLDLVGKPPVEDDVLAFGANANSDKRHELIHELLNDSDFGRNWGKYWRDVVIYRRTEDRALIASTYLEQVLTEMLNKNQPWSDVAKALITATGDVKENGATGLIVAQAGMPEDITSEVSRIFLGIQIQCAQCHDHPTDSWKREQFHQMAAFFPRVATRLNVEDRSIVVNTIDVEPRFRRPGNGNRFVGTLEHRMPDLQDPSAEGTLMQPVFFLTGAKLPSGTRDSVRRATLANWITSQDNEWFAKAFVNRTWSELCGEGFMEPVDDMGPDRPCVTPQTFDFLSKQFAKSNYDVKWLFETIMLTETYQRQSQSRRSPESTPFLANCPQRLRPDQLFDALLTALNLESRFPSAPADAPGPAFRRDPRFAFATVFGFDPSEPREDIGSSIPQALVMMNSGLFTQGITARRPDHLGGILARNRSDSDALIELYITTLGRSPTAKEQDTCASYIRDVGNRGEAFEDILWSLINSTEFLYRK